MGRTRAATRAMLAVLAAVPAAAQVLPEAPGPAAEVPVPGAPAAAPAPTGLPRESWPALEASPDVEVEWRTGLDGLVAGIPSLRGLKGLARVRVLAAAAGRGADRLVIVRSEDASFGGLPLGRLEVRVARAAGAKVADVSVALEGPVADASARLRADVGLDVKANRLSWGPGALEGQVDLRRLDLARLTAAFPFLALAGTVTGSARLAGDAARPDLDLALDAASLSWRGEAAGALHLSWAQRGDAATVMVRWGDDADPVATMDLTLPLAVHLRAGTAAWKDAGHHAVSLAAKGLTAQRLRPLWRAPAGADFAVDVALQGQGTLDGFALEGTLTGTYRARDGAPVPVAARLDAGPSRQSLSFDLGEGLARAALAVDLPLVAARRSGARLEPAAMTGALDLALPLPLAAPFLPSWLDRPEGVLRGHVKAAGTVGSPALAGSLRLEGGKATLLPLNRRLETLDLEADLEGDRLRVTRLAARSRPGLLEASADLRWQATPGDADPARGLWGDWRLEAALQAKAEEFPLVQPGLPVSVVKGEARVEARARPGDAAVSVSVASADVRFTKESLPKVRGIPVNPSVRVVDWLGHESGGGWLAGAGHLVLDVFLDPAARVHGEGVDLQVGERMVLDRRGPVVRVDGGLEAAKGGRFRLFGNRFEVKEGRFTLAEGHLLRRAEAAGGQGGAAALGDPDQPPVALPLEPILELVARGRSVGTDVLVKVQGPVRRPELVLASVPPLPEYQLLTLLIMGRADAVDDKNGEVRRQATALVERFHNPSLKRQLFDRLGVDKVGLGFGKNVKQPIITVGKQITRQIYVETLYHANAPPDTNRVQGHVEYRVDRNWTLDTTFGDRGEGGLGVFFATHFGGPKPPPPPEEGWGLVARGERPDTDGDGIEDPFDLCPDQPEDRDGWRDDDGCPDPDNDGDGVPDATDAAPDAAETFNGFEDQDGAPDVAPPRLEALGGRIRTALFEPGAAVLDAASRAALRVAGALLREVPGVRVVVEGHSDDLGTPEARLRVSARRAAAARAALAAAGVPGRGAATVGLGDGRPADPAGTEEARARNRRVEFRLEAVPEPTTR